MGSLKRKILIFFFYIAIGILLISSLIFILPVYNNYRHVLSRQRKLKEELNRTKAECMKLENEVSQLSHNPKWVEKVAREKFGLCGEGEIIYKIRYPENKK